MYTALRSALPLPALVEIYSVFLTDTEARMRTLRGQADRQAAHKALHAIHGSAGMIGARAVALAAYRLQQHSGAWPASLAGLEAACRDLRQALITGGLPL